VSALSARSRVGLVCAGRAYPLVHGGSFPTLKEVRTRRDFIAGELAAGRNPAETLRALVAEQQRPLHTVGAWRDKFLASRLDIDANTIKNYRTALKRVCERFGDREPASIGADEVSEWVADLSARYKPGTVQQYLIGFRLLLDYAGCDPNPARDPRVKLPKRTREEPQPPPAEQLTAILEALGPRWRPLFVTIEQGALRLRRGCQLALGRRRHGRPALASATLGDEA
jgi:integrase